MAAMSMEAIERYLQDLVVKVFQKFEMELIELKVAGLSKDLLIQIIADKPNGGINIRECVILNKAVVALIEEEKVLPPETFSLELSSPGLDRPLVTRKDFTRWIGRHIYFWLHAPIVLKGKKEMKARLLDVKDDGLMVEVSQGKKLLLPLDSIARGVLVIE